MYPNEEIFYFWVRHICTQMNFRQFYKCKSSRLLKVKIENII
nr:MAG TPA: hypothetical protein [Caudoviricetes sp.]